MDIYIKIIAMDQTNRVKSTFEETVRVPPALLALHEMMHGDNPRELVKAMGLSVYMGAKAELDAGRKNQKNAVNQMVEAGGRIGGASTAPVAAPPVHGPPGPAPAPAPARANPMAEALGLDLIQHAARAEGHVQQPGPPQQMRPAVAAQQVPQLQPPGPGPGPVGFASALPSGPGAGGPPIAGFPK